jgi:hypothetical protein
MGTGHEVIPKSAPQIGTVDLITARQTTSTPAPTKAEKSQTFPARDDPCPVETHHKNGHSITSDPVLTQFNLAARRIGRREPGSATAVGNPVAARVVIMRATARLDAGA